MRRKHWLARIIGLVLVVALGFGGVEYARGRRGPTPLPTSESMAAGRVLLERMLDATGARGLGETKRRRALLTATSTPPLLVRGGMRDFERERLTCFST